MGGAGGGVVGEGGLAVDFVNRHQQEGGKGGRH